MQRQHIKEEIEQDVKSVLENQSYNSDTGTQLAIKDLSGTLGNRIEHLMSETEQRLEAITSSYITGNIELDND